MQTNLNIFYLELILIALLYSIICYKTFQFKSFHTKLSNRVLIDNIHFGLDYHQHLSKDHIFHSKIFVQGLQLSALGSDLEYLEPTIDLDNMKLVDLKVLYKKLGRSPGNMRKSEIIAECRKYMTKCTTIGSSSASIMNDATLITSPLDSNSAISNSKRVYSTLDGVPTNKSSSITSKSSSSKINFSTSNNEPTIVPTSSNSSNKNNNNSNSSNISTKLKTRITMPPIEASRNTYLIGLGSSVNITDGKFMNTATTKTSLNNKTNKIDKSEPSIPSVLSEQQSRIGNRFPFELRDKRFIEDSLTVDLDLTFLGTASCMPTVTRGVSCLAMRYASDVWLFDCGESTQVQIQKSRIRPSKIKKIFITHTHGDHSFGLPGVLCLIGQARASEKLEANANSNFDPSLDEPIDIYGPEGIRDLVRGVLQMSYSRVAVNHRIHELKEVPFLHSKVMKPPPTSVIRTRLDIAFGERGGGRDIYPSEQLGGGNYDLFEDETFTVTCAPMQHTVPCVGYVVQEKNKPGALKIKTLLPIVEANKAALTKIFEVQGSSHLKVLSHLKDNIKYGESYTFPDGTTVYPEDYLESPKLGRKLVVMGDTCSGDRIIPLAMDADVLIHEATNAYLGEEEDNRNSRHSTSYSVLERDTYHHGHSTPQMAGKFAKTIRAKRLILTHFSPRYCGDDSFYSQKIMASIEDQAREASGLWNHKNDVVAAWDQMLIGVRNPRAEK